MQMMSVDGISLTRLVNLGCEEQIFTGNHTVTTLNQPSMIVLHAECMHAANFVRINIVS